ncbi:unnamed protein product [Diamesa serratosioi]
MFQLLAILLLCATIVLGELNFDRLVNDCIGNTLESAVKPCTIGDNFEVYALQDGLKTFRCLTYTRKYADDNHDELTIKFIPPINLRYIGAVSKESDAHKHIYKTYSNYTARFAFVSNDSQFQIKDILLNGNLVEKNWNCFSAERRDYTCGRQAARSNDLMKYGLHSNPGDYPWAVAIYQYCAEQNNDKYKCGGSIISTKHVLTSVNCLLDEGRLFLEHEVKVHVARYTLEAKSHYSRIYDIKKVLPHDKYNFHLKNNIAMLQTRLEIEFNDFVMPICLPSSESILNGALGKMVGFGKISSDIESKSKFLAVAEYCVTDISECTVKDELLFYYQSKEHFCAENTSGNIRISDLGSGLYFNNTNTWFIGGILSKPSSIPYISNYILFTQIEPFITWIQSTKLMQD